MSGSGKLSIESGSKLTGQLPNVLAILGADTGCEIYRIKMPFLRIPGANWVTQELLPTVPWQKYQVIVLPRLIPLNRDMVRGIKMNQRRGKVFIYETDDDYTNQDRCVVDPGDLKRVRELWEICDAITVSTPYLKKVMSQYNDNVYVLPNCIDIEDWRPFVDERNVAGLTIGLVGGDSHYDDWKMVLEPLMRIAEEEPQVRFVFGGYLPQYFEDLPRATFLDFVSYEKFPWIVRQVDIGLAPLRDVPFNASKSAIKVIEYMSSVRKYGKRLGGIPWIASVPGPYEAVRTGAGLLAKVPEDFYRHMKTLIHDPERRMRMGIKGLKWVRRNREIKHRAHKWMEVYNEVQMQRHRVI